MCPPIGDCHLTFTLGIGARHQAAKRGHVEDNKKEESLNPGGKMRRRMVILTSILGAAILLSGLAMNVMAKEEMSGEFASSKSDRNLIKDVLIGQAEIKVMLQEQQKEIKAMLRELNEKIDGMSINEENKR